MKRKRINIILWGTRGDIQPYIALGLGLQDAGHAVRITTHDNFGDWICRYGLDFTGTGEDIRESIESEQGLRYVEATGLATLRELRRIVSAGAAKMMQAILASAPGSDLLIGAFGTYVPVFTASQKLQIPWMLALLQPLHPTRCFPSLAIPHQQTLSGPLNYASYTLAEQALWWGVQRGSGNDVRRDLGMGTHPLLGVLAWARQHRIPTLYGYSPTLLPKPADWGSHIHVTGYWFLDEPDWNPDGDLVKFINAGSAAIYIGYGSMPARDPEALLQITLEALRLSGQRGILLTGWGSLKAEALSDQVFQVDNVPHAWLFPQMAAVVHHGGAGTTAAGLRAGVPTVITPVNADQPWWGTRLYRLGASPKPLMRRVLTSERLAAAIGEALTPRIREQADRLGDSIRAENGVGNAVRVIEQVLAQ